MNHHTTIRFPIAVCLSLLLGAAAAAAWEADPRCDPKYEKVPKVPSCQSELNAKKTALWRYKGAFGEIIPLDTCPDVGDSLGPLNAVLEDDDKWLEPEDPENAGDDLPEITIFLDFADTCEREFAAGFKVTALGDAFDAANRAYSDCLTQRQKLALEASIILFRNKTKRSTKLDPDDPRCKPPVAGGGDVGEVPPLVAENEDRDFGKGMSKADFEDAFENLSDEDQLITLEQFENGDLDGLLDSVNLEWLQDILDELG